MLELSQPQLMGILNITPDSFSDGGCFTAPLEALAHARQMLADGASILDIGGESTRPGALAVDEATEIERVVPVIRVLRDAGVSATISIDTSKPAVMRAAVAAGASWINDVYALRQPGAVETAAELGVPVCLMHMQGEPRTMQSSPQYEDVIAEVSAFLLKRVEVCVNAGISERNIVLDPGIGFGKSVAHNLSLLKHLPTFSALGFPVLVGVSRKSMLGALLNAPVDQRLHGTVAFTALAIAAGARIVRVHDVRANADALRVTLEMLRAY